MVKKKLCLVIPSLQAGGMERVMSELASYFCLKKELEVHMVLFGRVPELFYSVPSNLTVHMPNSAFNNRLRPVYTFGRLLYLRKTVSRVNPDSILSFGEYWNSFVLLALLGLPYPVYISDRCSPAKKFNVIHTCLRKWLYPKAKGVIAQTEKAKELYVSQFKNKNICVIGNPIRQIQNVESLTRENVVLSVGRLIESKHYDKLIEVFAKISYPGWKLIIVGDDAQKQQNMVKLKKEIKDLKKENEIILAGKQSNVEHYYLQSKIFAFTSSSEGFPNVIGEAMSAGLPVITFNCVAGPSEMIQNEKDGLLIPLFDFEMFQTRLVELIENEDMRNKLGFQARQSIQDYSIDNIGNKFYDFIFALS